jgi:hypothetical protein
MRPKAMNLWKKTPASRTSSGGSTASDQKPCASGWRSGRRSGCASAQRIPASTIRGPIAARAALRREGGTLSRSRVSARRTGLSINRVGAFLRLLPDRGRQPRGQLVRSLRDPRAGRRVDDARHEVDRRRELQFGDSEPAEDHERQGRRAERARPGPRLARPYFASSGGPGNGRAFSPREPHGHPVIPDGRGHECACGVYPGAYLDLPPRLWAGVFERLRLSQAGCRGKVQSRESRALRRK